MPEAISEDERTTFELRARIVRKWWAAQTKIVDAGVIEMILQHFVMNVPEHREGQHVCALRTPRAPVPDFAVGAETSERSCLRFWIVRTVAALAAPAASEALNLSGGQFATQIGSLIGSLVASK